MSDSTTDNVFSFPQTFEEAVDVRFADNAQYIKELPASVQQRLFENQNFYPHAFLRGLAAVSNDVFWPEDSQDAEDYNFAVLMARDKLMSFVSDHAPDFFPINDGFVDVPESVLEVLGGRYDVRLPSEWPEDISPIVRKLLSDVWDIKSDPFPGETHYAAASDKAKFVFLVHSAQLLNEMMDKLIAEPWDSEMLDGYERNALKPLRTLKFSNSKLENYILSTLDDIEFLRLNEADAHLWSLQTMRNLNAEKTKTYTELLVESGLPNSEIIHKAFNFVVGFYTHEAYISSREAHLRALRHSVSPARLFFDFRPEDKGNEDVHEVVAFGMLFDLLAEDGVWEILSEVFPADLVEKFKDWTVICNADDGWDDLDDPIIGMLKDMFLARDYFELERIDLVLNQDIVEMINPDTNLLVVKSSLLKMRNNMFDDKMFKHDPEFKKLFMELLSGVFDKFYKVARLHPVFNTEIVFDPPSGESQSVQDTTGNTDPSNNHDI